MGLPQLRGALAGGSIRGPFEVLGELLGLGLAADILLYRLLPDRWRSAAAGWGPWTEAGPWSAGDWLRQVGAVRVAIPRVLFHWAGGLGLPGADRDWWNGCVWDRYASHFLGDAELYCCIGRAADTLWLCVFFIFCCLTGEAAAGNPGYWSS
ncbi:hypothetical protein NDU88_002257 [Pleurodeles waltl]|uniref:Uncharacterized protein n=1 Tax=Pleurodeles waltl TaxID=8319 RepID=A0AAV7MV59_PLEWA|nr:hypothetical protein NDU88_002257 [Pleurodeles waltl]